MKPPSNYLSDILGNSGRFKALDGLRGLAVLAVVVYHFGAPFNTYYPSDAPSPYSFILGELGVQLFFAVVQRRNVSFLDRGPLQFLGKISYSLYLFHTVLGLGIIHLTQNSWGVWGSRVLASVVVITTAYISYQILERKVSSGLKRFLQEHL